MLHHSSFLLSTFIAVAQAAVLPRAEDNAPQLSIRGSTLTSKWIEGSDLVQVVELLISNDHATNYLNWEDTLSVTVESQSLDTVQPATLLRLGPKQTAVVQVGVKNKAGVVPGTRCDAKVVATYGQEYGQAITAQQDFSGSCGFGDYATNADSLDSHWNPDWFHEIKYGIFIHWGLYSVPAYGNAPGPKQDYAEWYWFRQHQPDFRTETYQYHEETYGRDFNYDDFIANFTASSFDPEDWMNLVADAGAQYVVPVTKHHDGWALNNHSATISKRSTFHYGPKRDFIKELLDVSKAQHPEIRRGTYFSMPEWYNPAYVPIGFDQNYQGNYYGRLPTNPYTNESIEYTGYVEHDDFIHDIQNPQIEALFYDYDTEILWCDIGGPNDVTKVIAPWVNWAREQGRQVTWNNRCGIGGDFNTPEYAGLAFSAQKFESNRGVDAFSFGYNFLTPDNDYLSAEEIVIDVINNVVSNGNLLLNIGPKADGSIPQVVRDNLLDSGAWIKSHGDGIYGTRYWSVKQISGNFRYATKPEAFFIHHLGAPSTTLEVVDPVPWMEGDTVTVLGGSQDGTIVSASRNSNGALVLSLNDAIVNGDKYIWSFKIAYATQ